MDTKIICGCCKDWTPKEATCNGCDDEICVGCTHDCHGCNQILCRACIHEVRTAGIWTAVHYCNRCYDAAQEAA